MLQFYNTIVYLHIVLGEAKHFSFITQKQNISQYYKHCRFYWKYKIQLWAFAKEPEGKLWWVFTTNTDTCGWSNQINWGRQRACLPESEGPILVEWEAFIQNHVGKILEDMIPWFEQWYGNLYSYLLPTSVNINSGKGDHIVFRACHILNCNVWL